MDLEYTVTEIIHRNRSGQIIQIDYLFDETITIDASNNLTSTGITRQNREKRNRVYNVSIHRHQYQSLDRQYTNGLDFESFVGVLRPFIMGHYTSDELERAFGILDRDRSGSIHLDELSAFLPILNESIQRNTLKDYVQKVDENFDDRLTYEEFRALVLRGIGRDIICNHL